MNIRVSGGHRQRKYLRGRVLIKWVKDTLFVAHATRFSDRVKLFQGVR